MAATSPTRRTVIVANRLPVSWSDSHGWVRSPGGLVTALESLVRGEPIEWFGSSASLGADLPTPRWPHGPLRPVDVGADLDRAAVMGMANSTLWPALHGLDRLVRWRGEWWEAYQEFNRRFAESIGDVVAENADVWVHDFHLLLVPELLRTSRPDLRVGLSLHTPFAADTIGDLPVADRLAAAVSATQLIGTQTRSDRDAVDTFVHVAGGRTRVVHSPVSIDPTPLERHHLDPTANLMLRRFLGGAADGRRSRRLVVGVDRLDYTKGIAPRLDAFDQAFRRGWLDPEAVEVVQIAQPSRATLADYRAVRLDVERRAHDLASRWQRDDGTSPIRLVTEPLDRRLVLALLASADIAVVTPVRDGMNLVAKEFSVVNEWRSGVLVLSRGAGAADELGASSVLVDGADAASVARGLQQATLLDAAERRRQAIGRAAAVRGWTSADWASSFRAELAAIDRAAS